MTRFPTWVSPTSHRLPLTSKPTLTLTPGFFSDVVGYGITYGHLAHTSQLDTTYAIVAALIAMDTPRQVAWHLANARRGGASLEEVRAVREMALRVARRAGVVWRNVVPEVEEAGEEEWEKEKRRR